MLWAVSLKEVVHSGFVSVGSGGGLLPGSRVLVSHGDRSDSDSDSLGGQACSPELDGYQTLIRIKN